MRVAEQRRRGVPFDGAELARRIDDLGDMQLSTASRHDAFAELYAAYTPAGFRLMPFPDDSALYGSEHRVVVRAVIADDTERQVVGEIERDLILDHDLVRHELLKLQGAYRGSGVSLVLLGQALPIYRRLGLRVVAVHAALETGRWHWACLVFSRMSRGQTPDVDTLLSLSAWLGVPLETYAHGEVVAPDSRSQTLEAIRGFLRADEALSEESAEAITSVLRAAYDQLAQRQEVAAAGPELAIAR